MTNTNRNYRERFSNEELHYISRYGVQESIQVHNVYLQLGNAYITSIAMMAEYERLSDSNLERDKVILEKMREITTSENKTVNLFGIANGIIKLCDEHEYEDYVKCTLKRNFRHVPIGEDYDRYYNLDPKRTNGGKMSYLEAPLTILIRTLRMYITSTVLNCFKGMKDTFPYDLKSYQSFYIINRKSRTTSNFVQFMDRLLVFYYMINNLTPNLSEISNIIVVANEAGKEDRYQKNLERNAEIARKKESNQETSDKKTTTHNKPKYTLKKEFQNQVSVVMSSNNRNVGNLKISKNQWLKKSSNVGNKGLSSNEETEEQPNEQTNETVEEQSNEPTEEQSNELKLNEN